MDREERSPAPGHQGAFPGEDLPDALQEVVSRRERRRIRREGMHRIGEGAFFALLLVSVLIVFVLLAREVQPVFGPGFP